MPTPAHRRQQDLAARRAKILSAARTLFAEHGVAGVTMRRLAKAVGYTAPVLYAHFSDKATLLRELCAEDATHLLVAMQRAAQVSNPLAKLRAIGYAYVEFALAHPEPFRLMFLTPVPLDDLHRISAGRSADDPALACYALLHTAVKEAATAGELPQGKAAVERTTQVLWGAAHGVVALQAILGASPDVRWSAVRPTARQLFDATLDGLVTRHRSGP